MSREAPLTLSIVSSMYRSEAFLTEFHARCTAAASRLAGSSYEIVLVNDGSPDRSLELAIDLHRRDPHVRVIDLSRNFGHHKALMTGLAHARGELVFLIDCDLEEDPAWLLTFHDLLRAESADVVYGVQGRRKGRWLERMTGLVFFGLFNRMLVHKIPVNVVTARLMTARYVKALIRHQEQEICLAGLWVITGFEQRPVTVEKGSRTDSTYTTRLRLSALANAITSFSNRPLVYIFQIGMAVMMMSVVAGAILLYRSLYGRIGVPGWASIMVSIWFLGGLIIFCVGVIGMYLAKIFTEIKHRPYTIVRAEYGSDEAGKGPALPLVSSDLLRGQARDYYEGKLREHGATPAGVDWNSFESQQLRFAQLAHLWRDDPDASILDYGCGYGALADYLRARGHRGDYIGFDVSAAMAEAAHARLAPLAGCRATARRGDLEPAHYAVASGVFNVKQGADEASWRTYVWDTVADLAALGTRGFAFNALTAYSDADKRRPDLYYADPLEGFDRCKRTYSRFVTLLHDYPLYEFTIIVRR